METNVSFLLLACVILLATSALSFQSQPFISAGKCKPLHYSERDHEPTRRDEPKSDPSTPFLNSIKKIIGHNDGSLQDDEESCLHESRATLDNFGDIMTTSLSDRQSTFLSNNDHGDYSMMSNDSSSPSSQSVGSNDQQYSTGLITSVEGGSLNDRFVVDPPLLPMDRVLLTANGNLQRIISSYYDAPVIVSVKRCTERISLLESPGEGELVGTCSHNQSLSSCSSPGIWDRSVDLQIFGKTFCTATSEITVNVPECADLVRGGKVGLGQLFR